MGLIVGGGGDESGVGCGLQAEAIDLLRKLDDRQAINCPIVANALPTLISVEELADEGRNPTFLKDRQPRSKTSD